jgi:crotonobetainyl-CoA:carnitine CoA-transferase CaiB-like acyl-CoA transferase
MPRIKASTAFDDLRILDLTRVRAGPTCVKQFADFGADVIKIESVEAEDLGGARDGSDFQNLHRNKRSMTLNLKAPEGKEIFMRLVKTADVVVENYRPDVKFRLGVDYETLKAVNKKIIYASISGFGEDGPYRERPGFDQIGQGMSGLMSVTGFPGQGPVRAGAAVADITAGMLAALGIMTALHERQRSGEGQWVQSNLLQGGLQLLDFQAARYIQSGEVAKQVGNDHPTNMPTSAYTTADGHMNVAASGTAMWKRLCDAIGRNDLLDNPDYKDMPARSQHRAALNAEIDKSMRTKTNAQWQEALNKAGIPCGPIYNIDQTFADPQVKHLGAAVEITHPRLGRQRILGQMVKLSRTPAGFAAATPDKGQHTDELLAELGYDKAAIAGFHASGVV